MTKYRPPWPCVSCDELIASSRQNVRLGVRRHHAYGLCERCYRRLSGWAVRGTWTQCRGGRPSAFDDVDEIAVERACHGDRVEMNFRERAEAIGRLTTQGMSSRQIAMKLGTTPRTVQRHRAMNRTAEEHRARKKRAA